MKTRLEFKQAIILAVVAAIILTMGTIFLYGCRTVQVTGYWHKENISNELQHSNLIEKQPELDISDCLQQVAGANPRFKGQRFELCMEEKGYVYELEVTKGGF